MKEYQLAMPRRVYSGAEAMQALGRLAAGHKKAAVFTDKGICASGIAQRPLDQLQAAGVEYRLFDELPAEPTCDQAQQVVDSFRAWGADLIVAVGGGSVMDVAKLASLTADGSCTVRELLADPGRGKKTVFSVMIPTTAGTGAEATPNSIVAVPEQQLKVGIVNPEMIADAVILDAEMIRRLPRAIAASTGVDTLCHAIECYISAKANPFSDLFAMQALRLVFANLEAACDDPDALDAKENMLQAAFYGGVAITCSGTTAVHALSYPLGGKYHVAHGVSNAILLSPVMHFNEPAIRERLAAAYDRAIHGEAVTVEEKSAAVIERMDQIVEHLDIPKKLDELGVSDVDVDQLAVAGMTVQRLLVNNMREVTLEDAKAIYAQVL